MTARAFGVHSGNRNFLSKSSTVILQWGRILGTLLQNFPYKTSELLNYFEYDIYFDGSAKNKEPPRK